MPPGDERKLIEMLKHVEVARKADPKIQEFLNLNAREWTKRQNRN